MLYLIGIGLNDEKDITLKGLDVIKSSSKVYLENYTSKLNCTIEDLERLYNKKIIIANRNLIENTETILKESIDKDIALLVIGDPFCATTHYELILRARKMNIKVNVINNASILTAIGITGLQLYNFGKTTSIPFDNKNIKTPIQVLNMNQKNKMHTLFLLDLDNENKRYMTINNALEYLIKNKVKNMLCIGVAGIGSLKPEIRVGRIKEIVNQKFNKLPQSLIIPGKLHFIEEEALNYYKKGGE